MPDQRTYPSVASRNDLDFNQRPDPLRKTRTWLIWTCAAVSLVPLGYTAVTSDETPYWAHQCSTPHQLFQDKCHACHTDPAQTVRMKVQGENYVRGVEDRTCRVCHPQYQTADHDPHLLIADAENCFRCHQEHRRKADISWVGDQHCTRCHSDLKTTDGNHSFAARIGSFDAHPEFALRRPADDESSRPGPSHGVFNVAAPSEEAAGTWADRSKIKFNHAYHLHADGVPIPPSHPDYDPSNTDPVQRVRLDCVSCHEMDAAGRYMQPINFERHCQACHELKFSRELHDESPDLKIDLSEPLPHEAPELVRGVMRDRLMAYAKAHPDEVNADTRPRASRLPQKPPRAEPTDRPAAEWVETRLQRLEARVAQGCRHCHVITSREEQTPLGPRFVWDVQSPEIPNRWLVQSEFRHDRHDTMRCADCHYRQAPSGPNTADVRDNEGSVYHSATARDVLMPSIETCYQCHSDSASRRTAGRARTDCVECHRYHHPNRGVSSDPGLVEALLRGD